MAEVTVYQLAEVVGIPVERLLKQMHEAGLSHSQPDQLVSDEDKQTLLTFLKSSHGEDTGEPRKITLKRKTISTLKAGSGDAKKTVSVEKRKKRTYLKRELGEEVESNIAGGAGADSFDHAPVIHTPNSDPFILPSFTRSSAETSAGAPAAGQRDADPQVGFSERLGDSKTSKSNVGIPIFIERPKADFHLGELGVQIFPFDKAMEPAASFENPSLEVAQPTDVLSDREFSVTSIDEAGVSVKTFSQLSTYYLLLGVTEPSGDNLAKGDLDVNDIPADGQLTSWWLTSSDVEFPEFPIVPNSGPASASINIHIPATGASELAKLKIRTKQQLGIISIVIYIMHNGVRENYRELSIDLAHGASPPVDSVVVAAAHTFVKPPADWTDPPVRVQLKIINGLVHVSTAKAAGVDYDFTENWGGYSKNIVGVIRNVRGALEDLRQNWQPYLDAVDIDDLRKRLSADKWRPLPQLDGGWDPLPDDADDSYRATAAEVFNSQQLRELASYGFTLFQRCFPPNSVLRQMLDSLPPGSRIDFNWTNQGGGDFVSHVPWALMYMREVDVTNNDAIDPEFFLGLRFRIASKVWPSPGSLALGRHDQSHGLKLLYWGDMKDDTVAAEAQWQATEFARWRHTHLVPDKRLGNLKQQVVRALYDPTPAPVAVIYFYCHCSVGDGAQPVLRFGNTAQPHDTLGLVDLSPRTMSSAPLVFANACSTVHADPHISSELEQAFFDRGIRAFIGTETKVPVHLASKFAWLFFRFFYRQDGDDSMTAGEALTQARLFLWTQYKNIGGLFYSIVNQYDLQLGSDEDIRMQRQR